MLFLYQYLTKTINFYVLDVLKQASTLLQKGEINIKTIKKLKPINFRAHLESRGSDLLLPLF